MTRQSDLSTWSRLTTGRSAVVRSITSSEGDQRTARTIEKVRCRLRPPPADNAAAALDAAGCAEWLRERAADINLVTFLDRILEIEDVAEVGDLIAVGFAHAAALDQVEN